MRIKKGRDHLTNRVLKQAVEHRGIGRHAAFRALAFKWQGIMWRCWHDQVPYDDAKYVDSLKRENDELYGRIIAFQSTPTGA